MDDAAKKVLDRLERQCSRCEYSRADVMTKALKALEFNRDAAREVVDSLVESGYVDDLRYAAAFAREKSSLTGWGPVKIRMALSSKGIQRDILDSALAEIDSSRASARLEKLMESKWRTLKGDPEARLKLLKYALGRGYGYDEVAAAADRIISSNR